MKHRRLIGIFVFGCTAAAVALSVSAADFIDPTRPYGYGTGTGKRGGLVLQSTVVSDGRKVAMINGRNYRVGDRVGKSTVVEILPHEVVLKRGDKTRRLRLIPKRERQHLAK